MPIVFGPVGPVAHYFVTLAFLRENEAMRFFAALVVGESARNTHSLP